jgi:plastocyanin
LLLPPILAREGHGCGSLREFDARMRVSTGSQTYELFYEKPQLPACHLGKHHMNADSSAVDNVHRQGEIATHPLMRRIERCAIAVRGIAAKQQSPDLTYHRAHPTAGFGFKVRRVIQTLGALAFLTGATWAFPAYCGQQIAINISQFAYDPASAEVAKGDTVTWTNQDKVSHTVTADDGSFKSGYLSNGQTFSHTFDQTGKFGYHCDVHPYMKGAISVIEGKLRN